MQKALRGALAASALAGLAFGSSTAAASPSTFKGRACSLVTSSAARAAGIQASCVEQTPAGTRTASATWGAADGSHYLVVRIGPLAVMHPLKASLEPRGPRWLGPIRIGPGIDAYYTLSAYRGAANREGAMRFVQEGNIVNISLIDASTGALPGLTAVAKSIERHLSSR